MGTQLALIRRELQEHRSLYMAPAILGLIVVLIFSTGQNNVSINGEHIDAALLVASNVGAHERGAVISAMLSVISVFFIVTMWILITIYSLGALYSERKDKSILFWRSLPVTDAETVISKTLTSIVIIPLITLAFIAATHVLALLAMSIWVGIRGADSWHLIWGAVPLFDNWGLTLMAMLGTTIWLSPYVGWFLLVSSYAKRWPFVFAVLPLIVLPLLEIKMFGSEVLAKQLLARFIEIGKYTIGMTDEVYQYVSSPDKSLMSMVDVGEFLKNPSVWGGLAVCGLLITAAVYVRRFRGET